MLNTLQVNADHMTKLQNFTKIHEILAFPFSLQLMFDQTLIVCLMISLKQHTKVAQTS